MIILSRIQAILMRHSKIPGPSILDAKMASLGGFPSDCMLGLWGGEPERYAAADVLHGALEIAWAPTFTPSKFNSSPLKNDGWKITFLLGWLIFRGYVKLPGSNIFQPLIFRGEFITNPNLPASFGPSNFALPNHIETDTFREAIVTNTVAV